jgi:hypothetical protein
VVRATLNVYRVSRFDCRDSRASGVRVGNPINISPLGMVQLNVAPSIGYGVSAFTKLLKLKWIRVVASQQMDDIRTGFHGQTS